jgi:metaxin
LHKLYIAPASSSGGVQAALAWQLRRAAAEQIVTSSSSSNGKLVSSGGADAVDEESVYAAAGEALEALAALLAGGTRGKEGEDRWFFGVERPTWFDAAVFSYTHLMMEFMGGDDEEEEEAPPLQQGAKTKIKAKTTLGAMVRDAGTGELARHRRRMLETAWPGWDGRTRA